MMGRGLERRNIFSNDEDKTDFLERLGIGLAQTQCQCLAFAMMSNHYHLLIRVESTPLSRLMSKLLSGYATQYNRRNNRSGYVFQNRFKSILCDADSYLLELIRYIHLNPIKANMLESITMLDRYPWTGHAGLMGHHIQSWQDRNSVWKLFSPQRARARALYKRFMVDGATKNITQDLSGGGLVRSYSGWDSVHLMRKEHEVRIGDERILGNSHFVETVLQDDRLSINRKSDWHVKGWDIKTLVNAVCTHFSVNPLEITHKGRQNSLSIVKSLVCYWGTQELGLSSTEIARCLNVSQPTISKAVKRGLQYSQAHTINLETIING
ncbi:hypothetical protein MNBD_GAMMA21-1113 [hydrothermal vent metagenome]|uniref:Transposase IS200-like domain-containing protein n=1 Tax=hydrothermal vent metagenome TaxID=652676 RepID=A0A3B1B786_9ZZZZ